MPQKQGRLPLYRDALRDAPRHWHPDGHPGLWWDKFCDLWVQNDQPGQGNWSVGVRTSRDRIVSSSEKLPKDEDQLWTGKAEWILSLLHARRDNRLVAPEATTEARLELGDPDRLATARTRLEALWQASGAAMVELELTAPFVTGTGYEHPTENGFLFHHSLGVPYLPGSMLKGLTRSFAVHWEDVDGEEIARIFGPPPASGALSVGSLVFFDALPTVPVKLCIEVMTPHYQPWYRAADAAARPPADWYDPTPIPFLALAPGAHFLFAVGPRRASNPQDVEDAKRALAWLEEALDWLGAGAKTAIGFGRFEEAGARQQRDAALGQEAAKARASAPAAGASPATRGPRNVPERVLGPARDFPVGTRVLYAGDAATVIDYDVQFLVLEFEDGERETVAPGEVERI